MNILGMMVGDNPVLPVLLYFTFTVTIFVVELG
jgi:hypothetical protein